MDITTELVQWLLNQGVAVFVLVWFLTRIEKRLAALEAAIVQAGIIVSHSPVNPNIPPPTTP